MSETGERLIRGLRQAVDMMDGKADPSTYRVTSYGDGVDVLGIRLRLGLSQPAFAEKYGFPLDTLRKWEQKTRRPTGAARILLQVIDNNPDAVTAAIDRFKADMQHQLAMANENEAVAKVRARGQYNSMEQMAEIAADFKARRVKARATQRALHRKEAKTA